MAEDATDGGLGAAGTASGPQMIVERIYLRDVSFESPNAPDVFTREWQPKVQVDINASNKRLDELRHEVVLTLTLEAKLDDDTGLIVELQQAGIFRLEGMDDALRERVAATACPTTLFPFARETVDSLVVKGTFPPFMLAPMNFDALYAQAKRRWEAEQQGDATIN